MSATVYTAPATLFLKVDDATGECLRVTVSPHEGDAGYYGDRLPDTVWSAVAENLERSRPDGDTASGTVAVIWEG